MAVLLLQLMGPMQAWGLQSRFDIRDTGREPSKSGVVGMLASALGRSRSEPIDDLAALRMGVRVDREGVLMRDFQTTMSVPKAAGGEFGTVTSDRYYLSDGAFLVGLEGERSRLETVSQALAIPRWPLYLGRRAMPPAEPLLVGNGELMDTTLETALQNHQWLHDYTHNPSRPAKVRLLIEVTPNDAHKAGVTVERRPDQPVTFMPPTHTIRYVATKFIPLPPEDRGGE